MFEIPSWYHFSSHLSQKYLTATRHQAYGLLWHLERTRRSEAVMWRQEEVKKERSQQQMPRFCWLLFFLGFSSNYC